MLIWDHALAKVLHSLQGHKYGVQNVSFSPDGCMMVSAGLYHDGNVFVWDVASGQRQYGVKIASKILSF